MTNCILIATLQGENSSTINELLGQCTGDISGLQTMLKELTTKVAHSGMEIRFSKIIKSFDCAALSDLVFKDKSSLKVNLEYGDNNTVELWYFNHLEYFQDL